MDGKTRLQSSRFGVVGADMKPCTTEALGCISGYGGCQGQPMPSIFFQRLAFYLKSLVVQGPRFEDFEGSTVVTIESQFGFATFPGLRHTEEMRGATGPL